jgi:hypothetical protein
MYDELRRKAERKVENKKGFYITAVVFGFISLLLVVISLAVPAGGFWIRFPILIFAMILGIIYVSAFGIPYSGILSHEWEEEEIEQEMMKIYNQRRRFLPPPEELTEEDELELQELERLKEKWEYDYDYDDDRNTYTS